MSSIEGKEGSGSLPDSQQDGQEWEEGSEASPQPQPSAPPPASTTEEDPEDPEEGLPDPDGLPPDIAELDSPVLIALAKAGDPHQPDPKVACRRCKGAIWMKTGSAVACFCTIMHLKVWESTDWMSYMELCDGKFLAEKKAQEEEAMQQD